MKWLVYIVGVALAFCLAFAAGRCSVENCEGDTVSVRVDSFVDTVIVFLRDTEPQIKKEKVVCYVPVEEVVRDTVRDTLTADEYDKMLAVVQREYGDDSTYTAWVSGLAYKRWPRLDSITVNQRTVQKTIKETVTLQQKASRWSVGVVGGYGYGLGYRGFEPFVGVGVSYRIFPP